MTRARRRHVGTASALIAATLLTACTSAVHQSQPPRPSASSAPSTSPATTPATSSGPSQSPSAPARHRRHHHRHHHKVSPTTLAASTHAPPPPRSTPPPPPSTPPPPRSTPPPPPPAPKSTCRHISIRVLPGGAVEGTEIAGLQFTNEGKKPCRLVGYPHVALLKGGHRVGTRSQPGGPTPGRVVTLAPGQTAQSILRDYSSCQAPLSESVRVTVPGESTKAVQPAQLRACTLRVSPLGPAH